MARTAMAQSLDLIQESLVKQDDSLLTSEQLRIKEELVFAFELLLTGEHTTKSCADKLRAQFADRSLTTCLARIRDAKTLFGDVGAGGRAMDALILYMRAERNYQDARKVKDVGLRIDLRTKLISLMAKLKGVDKEGGDPVDPRVYEAHTYVLKLSKPVKQVVIALAGRGAVDLDRDVPATLDVPATVVPPNAAG